MTIVDSGARKEYQSGALRDRREGKGRCDLLPLDAVARLYSGNVKQFFKQVALYVSFRNTGWLVSAIKSFYDITGWEQDTALLELSVHFEEGCAKYGPRNWQKGEVVNGEWSGITCDDYIDSAVRHLLKYMRGDNDERHDRAVLWNLICCLWTQMQIDNARESELVTNKAACND